MLMLAGLASLISVLASWGVRERVRSYFSLLLLAQASITGAVVSRDMFMFVLFWGASIVPIALLVGGWGGPRRVAAAWRLVGYWGVGTAALAIGVLALYAATGGQSFDLDSLLKSTLSTRIQLGVSVAVIIAGATRLPLFPLHGWERDVLAESPTGVVVLVATAASRLGAFVMLRTIIGGMPGAAKLLSPLLAALAALTILYAALAALRALDIRHAGAHLALVPGAITVLALAAVSPLGIAGAVLSLFTGGLAAALIAGVCATLSERAQTRSMAMLGGLAPRMPNVTWLLAIAALALLGVPILASFTSNVMTFFGAFKTQPIGAFAVAAGLVLSAVALSVLMARVLFGAPVPDSPGVSDASLGETWYLGLLAGALLWVGLFPGGPKIPGTGVPLFDPGLISQMSAGISDMGSSYVLPTPPPPASPAP
jgi:NADH-quinone oxidoreductase subunit M